MEINVIVNVSRRYLLFYEVNGGSCAKGTMSTSLPSVILEGVQSEFLM